MKALIAGVLLALIWLAWSYHDTLVAVEDMKKTDKEFLDHSVIKYEPFKWRE